MAHFKCHSATASKADAIALVGPGDFERTELAFHELKHEVSFGNGDHGR